MAAGSPYNIAGINDLAAGGVVNVLAGLEGRTLPENAMIAIFVNQELVTGSWQCTIGGTQVVIQGTPATVVAGGGLMPILPDDLLVLTAGERGDEIILNYTNGGGAAAEGRFKVFAIPMPAALLLKFAQAQGLSVPGAAAVLGST